VKSVHDFVGRDALERFAEMPSRWKGHCRGTVTTSSKIFASMIRSENRCKYMDIPASHYATLSYE
jgi:hypothetical protein